MEREVYQTCTGCRGKGTLVIRNTSTKCPKCNGKGFIPTNKEVEDYQEEE